MSEGGRNIDTLSDTVPPWSRAGAGSEPRLVRLRQHLSDGIASAGEGSLDARRTLGLEADLDDREVARVLVHAIAASEVPAVDLARDHRTDPRPTRERGSISGADSSFLGRLGAPGEELAVETLDDVRTLVAVLHGGTFRQRRAALLRLASRLTEGKGLSGDAARQAQRAIEGVRDVELVYERQVARMRLTGAAGRQARADHERWRKVVDRITPEIRAFWDGEREQEPVTSMAGDERAHLLLRVRDLPAMVVAHLGAIVEGTDGAVERVERLALISSLRYAGDRRLVPSLASVVEGDDTAFVSEGARALSRIDDPRVHRVLLEAYERSVLASERAVLAGAMGAVDDVRGAPYVRELLDSDDPTCLIAALEALETLGGPEDSERVVDLLDADRLPIVHQTVRTLARIADGRVLDELRELRERTEVSALRADIEDAEVAIRARMELRGEDVGERRTLAPRDKASEKKLAKRQDPAVVRLRSWKDYFFGQLWLLVGGVQRGVAWLEAAAATRPQWARPVVAIAMAWMRAGRTAQALAAFRRAIEAERGYVERHPVIIRTLARAFLRRAEDMERDGRTEIARALLDEVLALDLRHAPGAMRFELERHHQALRRKEGRGG